MLLLKFQYIEVREYFLASTHLLIFQRILRRTEPPCVNLSVIAVVEQLGEIQLNQK